MDKRINISSGASSSVSMSLSEENGVARVTEFFEITSPGSYSQAMGKINVLCIYSGQSWNYCISQVLLKISNPYRSIVQNKVRREASLRAIAMSSLSSGPQIFAMVLLRLPVKSKVTVSVLRQKQATCTGVWLFLLRICSISSATCQPTCFMMQRSKIWKKEASVGQ